jgi:hypothetical protein
MQDFLLRHFINPLNLKRWNTISPNLTRCLTGHCFIQAYSLLGYDAMVTGSLLLTVQRSVLPPSLLQSKNTVLGERVSLYRDRAPHGDIHSKPVGREVLLGGQSHTHTQFTFLVSSCFSTHFWPEQVKENTVYPQLLTFVAASSYHIVLSSPKQQSIITASGSVIIPSLALCKN